MGAPTGQFFVRRRSPASSRLTAVGMLLVAAAACSSGGGGGVTPDAATNDTASGTGGTPSGSGGSPGTGGAPGSGGAPGTGGTPVPPPDASDGPATKDTAAVDSASDTGPPATTQGQAGGACPGGAYPSPLPANLNATLVMANLGGELEGPVWVPSQKALFFAQGGGGASNGRIHKYTPADGKFTIFAMNVGVGGLAMDPQGMLVAAAYDGHKVSRFDPATGTRTDVAGGSSYMNQPFNEVNDVVVRADGNIYFSDPQNGPSPGNRQEAFYRLSPPPQSAVTLIYAAAKANGLAISPDGMSLYLATVGGPAIRRFALNADGSVNGTGTAMNQASSDGMAVDCAGNIYLSVAGGTNQIRVVSPADVVLGNIVGLGGGYVTNSAFGDEDRQTLYITTSAALYKIRLNVPGFPN